MNSQERVREALEFHRPDRIPIQVHPSPGGLFEHGQKYFCTGDGGMIWEQMHFLRPYEDCLVEIMEDTPEINRIADMITGCIEIDPGFKWENIQSLFECAMNLREGGPL